MSNEKKMNASALLGLNIVLLIGLIVLYILHFTSGNKSDNQKMNDNIAFNTSGLTITYIDSDSLTTNYKLVKDLTSELEQQTESYSEELDRRQRSFQSKVQNFQNNIKANRISQTQAENAQNQLAKEEQDLMSITQQYQNEIGLKEMQLQQIIVDSVTNYLQRYNVDSKYDYILSYTAGTTILVANDSLDITNHVLKALNTEYEKNSK